MSHYRLPMNGIPTRMRSPFVAASENLVILSQFVTSNLVSHFDSGNNASYSGTGTTWNNLVSGAGNATLNNVSYNPSLNGGSMHFNGNSQAIFATPPSIVTLGEITEEIWVKWTTTGNSVDSIQVILDNNHSANQGFVIQDLPFLSDQPIDSLYAQTTNRIGNWDWVCIAATVGATSAKIYINGVLNSSTNANGLKPIQPNVSMGKWQGGTRYLTGDIAILRLYNRELTSDEILQNFNASKSRFIKQNLITYSEEFNNPNAWNNENATITPDVETAPDGTTTADQLNFNSTTSKIYRLFGQAASVVSGQVYTHSVYLKTASGTFKLKLSRTNQASWATGKTSPEFTVTTTWQRFEYSYTVPNGETVSDFVIGDEDLTGYVLPNIGSVFAWGAQINSGNTALVYSKTVDAIIP